jgi:hypothetical protein
MVELPTTAVALLNSTTSTTFEVGQKRGAVFSVQPCQLKVDEAASITVLIAGTPEFAPRPGSRRSRLKKLRGDKPDDFEMTLSLPVPLLLRVFLGAGRIPATWRRKHR